MLAIAIRAKPGGYRHLTVCLQMKAECDDEDSFDNDGSYARHFGSSRHSDVISTSVRGTGMIKSNQIKQTWDRARIERSAE
jgi:hypothetical protein